MLDLALLDLDLLDLALLDLDLLDLAPYVIETFSDEVLDLLDVCF